MPSQSILLLLWIGQHSKAITMCSEFPCQKGYTAAARFIRCRQRGHAMVTSPASPSLAQSGHTVIPAPSILLLCQSLSLRKFQSSNSAKICPNKINQISHDILVRFHPRSSCLRERILTGLVSRLSVSEIGNRISRWMNNRINLKPYYK